MQQTLNDATCLNGLLIKFQDVESIMHILCVELLSQCLSAACLSWSKWPYSIKLCANWFTANNSMSKWFIIICTTVLSAFTVTECTKLINKNKKIKTEIIDCTFQSHAGTIAQYSATDDFAFLSAYANFDPRKIYTSPLIFLCLIYRSIRSINFLAWWLNWRGMAREVLWGLDAKFVSEDFSSPGIPQI